MIFPWVVHTEILTRKSGPRYFIDPMHIAIGHQTFIPFLFHGYEYVRTHTENTNCFGNVPSLWESGLFFFHDFFLMQTEADSGWFLGI